MLSLAISIGSLNCVKAHIYIFPHEATEKSLNGNQKIGLYLVGQYDGL